MPNSDDGSIEIRDGKIVITLDIDGSYWLASQLPENDGWTENLWRYHYRLYQQLHGSSEDSGNGG